MENSVIKTQKNREVRNSKPRKIRIMISDDDVRRRAFEIYSENGTSDHNELDDWLEAERELRGFNQIG